MLRDVLTAVTEVMPAQQVGVRLSPNGVYNDMGSPDFHEQFSYAAEQLSTFGLAYLHVMDGLAFGFHEIGAPMTLAEFRKVYKGTIIGNCGYTEENAEKAIAEGLADLIAFGRPYITNPDLVHRFAENLPLAPDADVKVWSAPGPKGYTDFPPASAS